MDLQKIAIEKLRSIDLIQEEINKLRKKEESYRLEIASIKNSISKYNEHLIGKKALCSVDDDTKFKQVECICSKVICTDDFNVKPLFKNKKGKKVLVDFYEWI